MSITLADFDCSDIANYTKVIRIAKYNIRGDVCGHALSPPLSTINRGRNANRQERLVYMRLITLPR